MEKKVIDLGHFSRTREIVAPTEVEILEMSESLKINHLYDMFFKLNKGESVVFENTLLIEFLLKQFRFPIEIDENYMDLYLEVFNALSEGDWVIEEKEYIKNDELNKDLFLTLAYKKNTNKGYFSNHRIFIGFTSLHGRYSVLPEIEINVQYKIIEDGVIKKQEKAGGIMNLLEMFRKIIKKLK